MKKMELMTKSSKEIIISSIERYKKSLSNLTCELDEINRVEVISQKKLIEMTAEEFLILLSHKENAKPKDLVERNIEYLKTKIAASVERLKSNDE